MSNELTDSQRLLIPIVKEQWLAFALSGQKIDKGKCTGLIKWVYSISGLKKPRVYYAQSPMGAQIMANVLADGVEAGVGDDVRNGVRDGVWAGVWAGVWDGVRDGVRDGVGAGVWAGVGDGVEAGVWAGVRAGVGDGVRAGVRAGVEKRKIKWYCFSPYVNFSDLGWVAFYDYFDRAGILEQVCEKSKVEDYRKYRELMLCGVYDTIQMKNVCIVVEMPKKSHNDNHGRRHNMKGHSLEWSDGWGIYEIHGVRFDKDEYLKFTSGGMDALDIMNEKNQDKKRVMAMEYGNEALIKELKAIELSREKDNQGNDMILWKINIVGDDPIIIYQGTCPSKGEVIYLRVPPMMENKKPIEAKIWTFKELWLDYEKTGVLPQFIQET